MFDSLSLTHCRHKFSTNMMLALCQADTAKDCRQVYMQIHNKLLILDSIYTVRLDFSRLRLIRIMIFGQILLRVAFKERGEDADFCAWEAFCFGLAMQDLSVRSSWASFSIATSLWSSWEAWSMVIEDLSLRLYPWSWWPPPSRAPSSWSSWEKFCFGLAMQNHQKHQDFYCKH